MKANENEPSGDLDNIERTGKPKKNTRKEC